MVVISQVAFVLFGFNLVIAINAEHGSTQTSYDTQTFKDQIFKKPHFIMFFAPWCGHCKRLAPTWDELAEKYNGADDSEIYIAKVDCTTETQLCAEHNVKGYPTVKLFKSEDDDPMLYKGKRDKESLETFIQEQLKEPEAPKPPEPKHGLYELTASTFKDHILQGNHFIKFYAPWCGHCKSLAPTWTELANGFQHSDDITIAKVDCTTYKEICDEYDVSGYPTLLFFKNGEKTEKYQGARDHVSLKNYVTKMIGKTPKSNQPLQEIVEDKIQEEEVEEESNVNVLTDDNFVEGISRGLTLVKFYAPWCGHCKRLAPIWEELATKVKDHQQISIAKVDCTVHKTTCKKYEVRGYPTLLLFNNGQNPEKYSMSREIDSLYSYLTDKLSQVRDEL